MTAAGASLPSTPQTPSSGGPAGTRTMGEESRSPRADLQGVRGLGVLLVVVGHLFLWPAGVFAALDMFFVLSGYLITGILVGSLGRYGARFFPAFYLSRFRRLMPMAVVVLVFTVVGTYLAYSGARAKLVGIDAVWAFFFAVNWHFMAEGTDYFALHTASPLQHYWSLSVEEQFYVVWPMLVLGAVLLARRVRSERARIAVVASVLGTVVVVSFAYSMWHSAAAPAESYFSTFDRAWEFGAGGLLALAANRLARLPRAVKMAASWVGVIGVLVTVNVIDTSVSFPAPWGLVPVVMTGLVIIGGLSCDTRHNVLLHNPVMIYIGNISYSVYLWHMPVQVILVPYFGGLTVAYFASSLLATAFLSVVGYHTIEKPLRRARWLMTAQERERLKPAPLFEPVVGRILKATRGYLVIGGMLAFIYVGLVAVRSGVLAPPAAADPPPAELVAQQARLSEALAAPAFPVFAPSLDEIADSTWEAEHAGVACIDIDLADLPACRFGPADAPRTVAVVGDSFGVAWMPAILDAFEPRGWAVQQLTLTQCPTWTLPSYVKRDETDFPDCGVLHDEVAQYVAAEQPDLLIIASSYDQVINTQRPDVTDDGAELAETGLAATLAAVANPATRVAVLQPPPPHESLIDCVSRAGRPRDCTSAPSEYWYEHTTGEQAAVAAAPDVTYVSTLDWFCVDDRCPGFVGSTPVTVEGVHMTVEYARQLSELLAGAFPELLAPDPGFAVE